MPKLGVAGQSIVSFGITGHYNHRSCRILYPDRTAAGRTVAAVVRSGPGPRYTILIVTGSRSRLVIEGDRHTRITGIRCCGHAKACVAGQSIVSFGITGHTITGAVVSCTQIVRLQVEVLLQSSVAVQVLVTLYSLAQSPGVIWSLKVIVTLASQASVAVAMPKLGVAGQSIVSFGSPDIQSQGRCCLVL